MNKATDARVAYTRKTKAAFHGKPFRLGTRDCLRMFAWHVRQFGYTVRLPRQGAYRTEKTARRLLEAHGFSDLAAAIDSLGLARIAPARALPGDIIMIPAEGALGGSIQIYLGNGRTLGYHQDCRDAVVLQPVEYLAAWRIECACP
jgi:hypothetical protein